MKVGSGCDRDDFDLWRWRRGVGGDDFGWRSGGWRLHINRPVAINHLTFHAAGKQWQAGGD